MFYWLVSDTHKNLLDIFPPTIPIVCIERIKHAGHKKQHKSESHLTVFGDAIHRKRWAKNVYMLDCCIQSKLNGCDQYFPFDFGTRFLHTRFLAHASRMRFGETTTTAAATAEYSTWNGTAVEKGQSIEHFFRFLIETKSLHKLYAPTYGVFHADFPSFP